MSPGQGVPSGATTATLRTVSSAAGGHHGGHQWNTLTRRSLCNGSNLPLPPPDQRSATLGPGFTGFRGGNTLDEVGGLTYGIRGGSTLGEVGVVPVRQVSHYNSTPHLFVFQPDPDTDSDPDDDDEDPGEDQVDRIPTHQPPPPQKPPHHQPLSHPPQQQQQQYHDQQQQQQMQKEPIYSSAIEVRKSQAQQEAAAVARINEKYDSFRGLRREESLVDPLAVTDEDINRIETFYRGHKTQLWVCNTMANLYAEGGANTTHQGWELKYTGVPVLLLDQGDTKSRNKRILQISLAEKGTGFPLWRDVVDNLTSYRQQEPHFHTLYLSSDHRKRMGLSFNEAKAAQEFHKHLERLTADPANICLSGPGKKNKIKKEKLPKYKAPRKTDISIPCNFHHVTSVDAHDKTRFFSLQEFSKMMKPPPLPASQELPIQSQSPMHTVAERPVSMVAALPITKV